MNKLPVAAIAAIVVVLAIGTFIEGKLSDRWGRESSEKLNSFTQRLDNVPKTFGDWVGVDDEFDEESQKEFEASNCDGCVSRTYTNREGQRINMYLVSGSARHVTIHTPDWCYPGAGYVKEESPVQYTIKDVNVKQDPEFMTARFKKEDQFTSSDLRIFWTFSDDGAWRGPRMPKPAYAGRSAMYKMYLITEVGQSIGYDIESNPTLGFVHDFVPVLNQALFAAETPQE